jgi:hypothetical protein
MVRTVPAIVLGGHSSQLPCLALPCLALRDVAAIVAPEWIGLDHRFGWAADATYLGLPQ